MSSDGLGSCSVKQEVEEKENCHLEQNQVKVSLAATHQGSQRQDREFLGKMDGMETC